MDRYTKTVLTVIAGCLLIQTAQDLSIIEKAHAQTDVKVNICDLVGQHCADVRPNGDGTDGLVVHIPR